MSGRGALEADGLKGVASTSELTRGLQCTGSYAIKDDGQRGWVSRSAVMRPKLFIGADVFAPVMQIPSWSARLPLLHRTRFRY